MGAERRLDVRCAAEAVGTFLLVFFGCGAVHVAVLTGALSGLWQLAVVWGAAVALATFVVGGVSGAHINPAVTLALAIYRRFPWRDVPVYIIGQLGGAMVAAAVLFALYHPFLAERERTWNVVRGQPGSELTATCYCEYFPNPGLLELDDKKYDRTQHERLNARVSHGAAMLAEVIGTMFLALVVFAVADARNAAAPPARLAPAFIGLTIAALIAVIAPLTQACFNPARDFGPRVFAAVAGWGEVALPGPRAPGFFTVYILAPVVGAVVGGGLYLGVVRPGLPTVETEETRNS